jgi:hypothetical protein
MRRIRQHLTYANVMATLAVFLVLGGGTAFAAYVVSSNSQIGPGTVSGHHAPSGKHANIIAGSINGQDVQHLVFQPLTLKNGWTGNCSGGGLPAIAKSVEGIVYFRGAICETPGSSNPAFTVPAGFAPSKTEFLAVDELSGYTGRIVINTNGNVVVEPDPDHPNTSFSGFTSLAGTSYTLPF